MLPIFQEERWAHKQKKVINEENLGTNPAAIFRGQLTRIEKWRVILFWVYIKTIATQFTQTVTTLRPKRDANTESTTTPKNRDILLEEMKQSIMSLSEIASSDWEVLEALTIYKPAIKLRQYCTESFNIYSANIGFALDHLDSLSKGFHKGYQRCSIIVCLS
jgi:hypothetical protein